MPKNFYKAVAVMIGYVIGVGMFGLPYVVAKAGLLVFFIFIIFFGSIQYLLHLIYANLIISTKEDHRLAGFAGIYFGKKGKHTAFAAKTIGNIGALLAYLIIIGIFLNELLGPVFGGSEFLYSTGVFIFGAIVVFFGISAIASVEFLMSALLLMVVVLIVIKGWGAVDYSGFKAFDWRYIFLPYGAMLMALDGNGSLPIVAKLLKRDPVAVKKVVGLGTLIPILVIIAFVVVVVGISGAGTTPDALVGVKAVLDDGVIFFSLIFGVLTMITSFILVAESVKETLWWDYKVKKSIAWAVAIFTPYVLFLIGLKNLTKVIGFAGGAAGGLSAIMLILIFRKIKGLPGHTPLFNFKIRDGFLYFLIGLFIIGIVYEIFF